MGTQVKREKCGCWGATVAFGGSMPSRDPAVIASARRIIRPTRKRARAADISDAIIIHRPDCPIIVAAEIVWQSAARVWKNARNISRANVAETRAILTDGSDYEMARKDEAEAWDALENNKG